MTVWEQLSGPCGLSEFGEMTHGAFFPASAHKGEGPEHGERIAWATVYHKASAQAQAQ